MIKEITKVNNIHNGASAVNGLGKKIPEEEVIMINVDKIESIIPPATTTEPGAFAMRYAGETIYVSNECFHELAQSWIKANEIFVYQKPESERMYEGCKEWDEKILDATRNMYEKRPDDNRPVTERIRTMTDVFEELGAEHPLVAQYLQITEYGYQDEYLITFMQLRMVCEALNEGWHPTFEPGEYRYWPWFWLYKSKEDAERLKKNNEEIFELPSAVRACLWGGGTSIGALDGFAFADSGNALSFTRTRVGSHLCLKSRELSKHAGKYFHELWLKYYCM